MAAGMVIDRIELYDVQIPLPAAFAPAWIPGLHQHENHFTLVRLCAGGVCGWSAAPSMGRERTGVGDLLGTYFLGERADDLESVRQRLREMGYLGFRLGWVEPACWDLVGRARGRAVFELLGADRREVRGRPVKLYASTGELKDGAARVREVEARLAEGFRAVKLRVHAATLDEDVAQVRAVRQAVGDDVVLGVDANQGWRVAVVADAPAWDYARAEAFCHAMEELGVRWVEEPLPMDDYDALARLRAATDVDIAGGEINSQGLPEFQVMLDRGCFDVVQPDAVFTGGIGETWAIARRARAAGVRYTPHTWTNGLGFGINLQLFAAAGEPEGLLEYPLAPPGWLPRYRDGLLREPFEHQQGALRMPEGAGLGFEIDPRALRRFGRRFYVADKVRVAVRALRERGVREALRLKGIRDARLAARSRDVEDVIAAGGDPLVDPARGLGPVKS